MVGEAQLEQYTDLGVKALFLKGGGEEKENIAAA